MNDGKEGVGFESSWKLSLENVRRRQECEETILKPPVAKHLTCVKQPIVIAESTEHLLSNV